MLKNKIILNILLFTGVLFAQPSFQFGQNYHVVPQENIDQKFPHAVFDSTGVLHMVWVTDINGHKDVYYARSTDSGITFSEPERLNSHVQTVVAYVQAGPKVAIRGNEVIVAFMDDRTGYTSVYINNSIDNGLNWIGDEKVSDQLYLVAYPSIGIGLDGKIHLFYYSYNQNNSFNSVRYSIAPAGDIDFSASLPMGITTEEMEPCDCCQSDIEISETGDIFFAYRNNISNQRKHFIVRKDFNLDFFEEPIQMSNFNDYASYCPASGPSISIEENNIASGFHVSQHNNSYINYSSLESLSFTEEINVNPGSGASQNFPIVVLKESVIHSIWVDYRNGNPDIYYGATELGGDELVNEQRMSDDSEESNFVQKDPFLIRSGDNLICFWSDNRTGDYQIFIATTGGPQSLTITLNLNSDWNLIGLPLNVDDSSYEVLFPSAVEGTLYGFGESYELVSHLDLGSGYWLRFESPDSTEINGLPTDVLEVQLVDGWNLFSGSHQEINVDQIIDPDAIIIAGTIYQFDVGYYNVESIIPGKGYWIRSSGEGTLYITE